ncbi:DMT family transporter [Aliiroseovarius sp.]|uniref:DMT family transporter n=1 Tax=Aliiroseovarius sp. TaxID=1872442 RepID=UPI003BA9DE3B
MTQQDMSARAWAELFLLGLIWGGVFLATRVALDEITVLHSVAHRVGWAAVILWAYVLLRRLPVPLDARTWAAFAVMGALNNLIPFSLLNWSQLYIESGLTSIFNATTAVFGVLVAAIFFADERLTARKSLGVGLGFAGVVVTIGISNLASFDPRSLAQLAAIAATLSYALAGVWARKRLAHLPPQVAAMGMLTASAALIIPAAWLIEGPIPLALSAPTWAGIGYMAVIATAGAYLLYYRILAMAGSGNLMLVTLLIPPVAITLGTGLRGENLPASAFAGLALLALGLIVLDGRVFKLLGRRSSA